MYLQSKRKAPKEKEEEITEVVHRHIKPGYESQYSDWFGRMVETIKRFPGYKGASVIIPDHTDLNERIVIYRFVNEESLNRWRDSPERKKLLWEVDKYATQTYERAKGMETWFQLQKMQSQAKPPAPPPKWKMALVLFICASLIGITSRLILSPYIGGYSLFVTGPIYALILVLCLTYAVMPYLTELLKGWLYPGSK